MPPAAPDPEFDPRATLRMLRATPRLAVERLTKRIDAGTADHRTYHNLAIAERGNDEIDRAIAASEKAIEFAPDVAVVHLLHGLLLRDADRFSDALEAFGRVEAIDPDAPRLHASRGVVRFHVDDVEGAARDLQHAIVIDPVDRISHFNLAIVQIARKKFGLAHQAFERCLELEPERARLYHRYLIELGRAEVVEETLQQAHRIKNRVSLVGNQLRGLADRLAPALSPGDAETMRAVQEDQNRIREDLVSFLAAVRPKPMKIEAVCPRRLIDRILFVASASSAKVEFEKFYEEDLPLVRCDVEAIQEAILNLVLNAVDAVEMADRVGRVAVRVMTSGDDLVVEIEDDGDGVDPEIADRVFRFGFTTKSLGSGVGLAQTRRAIEDHGGSIELERGRSKGARFMVRLPRAAEASPKLAHLAFRSQLLDEPQALMLEESADDLGL